MAAEGRGCVETRIWRFRCERSPDGRGPEAAQGKYFLLRRVRSENRSAEMGLQVSFHTASAECIDDGSNRHKGAESGQLAFWQVIALGHLKRPLGGANGTAFQHSLRR